MLVSVLLVSSLLSVVYAVPNVGNALKNADDTTFVPIGDVAYARETNELTYTDAGGAAHTLKVERVVRYTEETATADNLPLRLAYTFHGTSNNEDVSVTLAQYAKENAEDQPLLESIYSEFKDFDLPEDEKDITHAARVLFTDLQAEHPIKLVSIEKAEDESFVINAIFDWQGFLDANEGLYTQEAVDALKETVATALANRQAPNVAFTEQGLQRKSKTHVGDFVSRISFSGEMRNRRVARRAAESAVVQRSAAPNTPMPTLSPDDDEGRFEERKRHRHHGHHHHHSEDASEAGRFLNIKQDRGFYGVGKPPLAGGVNMIGSSMPNAAGTLGGLLIATTPTTNDYKDYQLYALSCEHVVDSSPKGCQPAVVFSSPCKELGPVSAKCCLSTSGKQCTTGTPPACISNDMDASITKITAPADVTGTNPSRHNVKCSQFTSIPAAGGATTTVDVTKAESFATGDVVTKYGARTHFTNGKIFRTVASTPNTKWRIVGTKTGTAPDAMPLFTDIGSQAVVPPTGSTASTVRPQLEPSNEAGWFLKEVRGEIEPEILKVIKPGTSPPRKYNNAEAQAIFDDLWDNNMIDGWFSSPGDSGSWVMKDGGVVIGMLCSGWPEVDPSVPCRTVDGTCWGKFIDVSNGFGIFDAVATVDLQLFLNGVRDVSLDICVESRRPKPDTDCATDATVVAAGGVGVANTCTFPWTCKKSGSACTERGALGN